MSPSVGYSWLRSKNYICLSYYGERLVLFSCWWRSVFSQRRLRAIISEIRCWISYCKDSSHSPLELALLPSWVSARNSSTLDKSCWRLTAMARLRADLSMSLRMSLISWDTTERFVAGWLTFYCTFLNSFSLELDGSLDSCASLVRNSKVDPSDVSVESRFSRCCSWERLGRLLDSFSSFDDDKLIPLDISSECRWFMRFPFQISPWFVLSFVIRSLCPLAPRLPSPALSVCSV